MNNSLDRPLQGLKVLDFSRVLAGPFATRLLCDLGADVLKVEEPAGDISRHLGRTAPGASGFYLQQNIGKRNICVDLKAEGARELVLDLAMGCDIVVENFRPGVMEKFGLAWEDLHAVNPKLVMLSISGFGQTGPERTRAAYAAVVHAEAGLVARQAHVGGSACDLQLSFADTVSALHGLVGLLAALRSAEKTGIGQQVDMAMISAVHSSDDFAHWALDDAWPRAPENLVWDAPEGKKLILAGSIELLWQFFSVPDGLFDPAPLEVGDDKRNRLRHDEIQKYLLSFPDIASLTAALGTYNIAWGKVRAFGQEAYDQPSAKAMKVIVDVEDDTGRRRQTVQSPYRFSNSSSGLKADTRLARRGENNVEALRDWLGLTAGDVDELAHRGVLLCET